jgi:hypothetical protein
MAHVDIMMGYLSLLATGVWIFYATRKAPPVVPMARRKYFGMAIAQSSFALHEFSRGFLGTTFQDSILYNSIEAISVCGGVAGLAIALHAITQLNNRGA